MKVIHITPVIKKSASEGAGWVSTIAEEFHNFYPNNEIEIWQVVPSLTDMHLIESELGIKYRFFPGQLQTDGYAKSDILIDWIKNNLDELSVLHIHGQLKGVAALVAYKYSEKYTTVFSFWGPINVKQKEWMDIRASFIKLVTYCNDHDLDQFRSIYSGRIEELTVGVDTNFFTPLDKSGCRDLMGIKSDRFVMVMVARFIGWKQIGEFIEIIKSIKDDFLLLIVGDGPLNSELRLSAIDLVASDRVRFMGYIPRQSRDILFVLNSADLFVTTSRGEGASGAVMEALSCGIPIFSTNFGGIIPFLKNENVGIIVDINPSPMWSEKLVQYIERKLTLPRVDREKVSLVFSWKSIAGKLNGYYKSSIN